MNGSLTSKPNHDQFKIQVVLDRDDSPPGHQNGIINKQDDVQSVNNLHTGSNSIAEDLEQQNDAYASDVNLSMEEKDKPDGFDLLFKMKRADDDHYSFGRNKDENSNMFARRSSRRSSIAKLRRTLKRNNKIE